MTESQSASFAEKRRILQLETLNDLAVALYAHRPEQELIDELLERVCAVLDPAAAAAVTRDRFGVPRALAVVGWQEGPPDPANLLSGSLWHELLASGHTVALSGGELAGRKFETLLATPVSYRGVFLGFVAVLDDKTLLIPDRLGNRRLDSLSNIQENPNVGLLFFVPGMNETLRVNGTAEITFDRDLLAPLAVRGKLPQSGLLVTVREAFLHCAKAFIRSRLWDPAAQVDRKSFPSLGQMIADHVEGTDPEEAEAHVQESYRKRLY